MGEIQRSWDLLEDHDDEKKAVFSWAWVLLFLLTGDEDAARDALDHALEGNPRVAPWLLGMEEDPGDSGDELPPFVEPGSEDEARLCAGILGEAWEAAGPAQWWLYNTLVELGLIHPLNEEPDPEPPVAH